jgi:hypothetical protein
VSKKKSKKKDFKTIVINLGILFSIILFVVKLSFGSVGWIGVFTPVLIAFLITLLLSTLKNLINKI